MGEVFSIILDRPIPPGTTDSTIVITWYCALATEQEIKIKNARSIVFMIIAIKE
jgi:hypothetical protein